MASNTHPDEAGHFDTFSNVSEHVSRGQGSSPVQTTPPPGNGNDAAPAASPLEHRPNSPPDSLAGSLQPSRVRASRTAQNVVATSATVDAARTAFLQPRVAEFYLLYRHDSEEEAEQMSRPVKDLAGIVAWNKQFDEVRTYARAHRADRRNLSSEGIDNDVCEKLHAYTAQPSQWQMVVDSLKKQGDEAEKTFAKFRKVELAEIMAKERADSAKVQSERRADMKVVTRKSNGRDTAGEKTGQSRIGKMFRGAFAARSVSRYGQTPESAGQSTPRGV